MPALGTQGPEDGGVPRGAVWYRQIGGPTPYAALLCSLPRSHRAFNSACSEICTSKESRVMRATLPHLSRAIAGVMSAALVARFGIAALAALVFLAVLVIAVFCWTIKNKDRSINASRIIVARRGDPRCLDPKPAGHAVERRVAPPPLESRRRHGRKGPTKASARLPVRPGAAETPSRSE
jgi:hypothetical protein